MDARKLDTRNKIQLGGLVIKAGLAEEEAAVILGALVVAAEALGAPDGDGMRQFYRKLGDEAFSGGKDGSTP